MCIALHIIECSVRQTWNVALDRESRTPIGKSAQDTLPRYELVNCWLVAIARMKLN